MDRLFLAFVIIGVVAPTEGPHNFIEFATPSKGNGTGQESVFVTIKTYLPYDERTVVEETEIRNNAARLGTVTSSGAVKFFALPYGGALLKYVAVLQPGDCSEVISYITDVVLNTKHFYSGAVFCEPMQSTINYTLYWADITKDHIIKTQREFERLPTRGS
uniref:Salivary lipocalin n=1 Tax=Haemonchus contortus TaxID=6289 RepID=A0A7I4YIB4_HAECO